MTEEERWNQYLDRLDNVAVQSSRVREIWNELSSRYSDLPLPISHFTEDNVIKLAWDLGAKTVEIDISPSGGIEWFYHNSDTSEVEGTEEEEEQISDDLWKCLQYVIE